MFGIKHNPTTRRRAGITLLETVVSMLILGGAFVAALTTIGQARKSQRLVMEHRLGLILAEDIMDELMNQSLYKEDETMGVEDDEIKGRRSTFDDFDDYHDYTKSPIQDIDGNNIPGTEDYRIRVNIHRVDPADTSRVVSTDMGLLKIYVRVRYKRRLVAQLVAYRSDKYKPPSGEY